jgi:PadR family transcriptional regulator PadR
MDNSQVLKGVLDVDVLCVVSEEDCYGYELVKRLRELGLTEVAEASVYGTLRRLYSAGLLSSYVVASDDGPHRKYYNLTNAGSKSLLNGLSEWDQFVNAMKAVVRVARIQEG